MIYLTTGAVGAGKTLFTLQEVRTFQLESEKNGLPRSVYYSGIILKPQALAFGWQEFEPTEWMNYPDGAIFLIDECQRIFPTRGLSNKDIPDFEQQLDTHRHRGFDFFLITQHPSNISTFVRKIIASPGWHRHYKNIFGSKKVQCLEFSYVETNCEKPDATKNAQVSYKKHPKEVYEWYQSSVLHTTKRKLPKILLVFPIIFAILGLCVYTFLGFVTPKEENTPTVLEQIVPTTSLKPSHHENNRRATFSTEDYLQSHTPRIEGFPHTASRYDEVTKPVIAPYPAACMIFGDKGCRCFTQQGTRIMMNESICENIVREGFFVDWNTKPQDSRRSDHEN